MADGVYLFGRRNERLNDTGAQLPRRECDSREHRGSIDSHINNELGELKLDAGVIKELGQVSGLLVRSWSGLGVAASMANNQIMCSKQR